MKRISQRYETLALIGIMTSGLILCTESPSHAEPRPALSASSPSLQWQQRRIQERYLVWLDRLNTLLTTTDPSALTPRDRDIYHQLSRVFFTARAFAPDRDMNTAKSHLSRSAFDQALPPEEEAINKLEALLYKQCGGEGGTPGGCGGDGEGLPEWKKSLPAKNPPSPSDSKIPEPDTRGNPSTSSPTSQDHHKGGSLSQTPRHNDLADHGDWSKLPPHQLERLIETRLDTLPTEHGWREMVKQYFLKVAGKTKKHSLYQE